MSEKNSRETRSCKEKGLPVSYTCGGDSRRALSNQEITFHRAPGWTRMNYGHSCSSQVKAACLKMTGSSLTSFAASKGKFHTKVTVLKASLAAGSKSDSS